MFTGGAVQAPPSMLFVVFPPGPILVHAGVNNFMSMAYGPMFPSIDARDTAAHVMLPAFGVASIVPLVTAKGGLGYVPAVEVPAPKDPASSQSDRDPGENVQA
ncbi:MAG TPA: hypothetical protein K8V84_04090 [Nocardiopsis listeri]|uniref:hypothetical protein n=1 Tax=Nocardiopsis listeri TaxID=53440 RepID=UPI001D3B87C2|nr:hypothetical protein [Nocardiopsis listeri]HJE57682.1 hypothetical protein [Nocardiopsis listeri]